MKKKVAIVAQGLHGGGTERVACMLADYLADREYDVCYIAVYNEKREYYLKDTVPVFFIHTKKTDRLSKLVDRNIQIYNIIKEKQIEEIVSFVTNEVLLAQMWGVPTIHTLRNDPEHEDCGFWLRSFRNFAYSHAKHIVFQTAGAKSYFSEKIQRKGSVIPNPLMIDKMPVWNKETRSKTFVTACRLTKQKNLPMLINAFTCFHQNHQDFSLEIYGEGELREEIDSLINKNSASGYVGLMGRSSRIYDIMSNAYGFVLSSDYEGLSNAMIEALAIGVPSICTDCPPGGARAFIRDGENGLLVPVGDERAMCGALIKLAEDRALCEQISDAAMGIRKILACDTICSEWESLI